MGLSVLTPAPVTDLIELASVKRRLGITDTSEDVLLAEYINEVTSDFHEAEVFGRVLARQRYAETFYPSRAVPELRLSCNPVDSGSVTVEIDGEAITDLEVREPEAGLLYRQGGWPVRCGSAEGDGIEVIYKGGFLIPASATAAGVVTNWTAGTAYVVGAWVRAVGAPQALRFECATAGTSHASTEPSWPTTPGSTATDGTVTWTARQAWELPPVLRQLAAIAVRDLRETAARPAGLLASQGDGFLESYSASGSTSTGLSAELLNRLGPLRARYGRT